jgi:hypothetical protein
VIAPKRFEPEAKTKELMGYSDHYPILIKIDYPEIKNPKKKN